MNTEAAGRHTPIPTTPPQTVFLRLPEVKKRVGLSTTTIYRLLSEKDFPPSIPLGGRIVAWIESEIEEWCQSRIKAAKTS